MKRTYENALKLLETRRRKARPAPTVSTLKNAATANSSQRLRGLPSLVGMKEWLQRLGHSDDDVNNLNIIHITGTKGKGSTCAFTRSFLLTHGLRTGFPIRVGLYTSPAVRSVRERIQINSHPIAEELFTRYFFEVYERIFPDLTDGQSQRQPRYLQFLALMAFHAFIREKVQAAIFETHHGGEFDATNVVQKPVVTGITSLGLDHVEQLGPTIDNIAWHKSGIFKPGAPAFSVPQETGPSGVLKRRAAERNTSLHFSSPIECLPTDNGILSVPAQRMNCSLGLDLAKTFLQLKAPGHTLCPDDVIDGIQNFSWIGRFEVINDGASQWFVDGAHNSLSLEQTAAWYATNVNAADPRKRRVLIFSHFSEERDGIKLLECIARALFENDARPDYVIFTTYHEREDGTTRIDKTLKVPETPFPDLCGKYSSMWKTFDPQAKVSTDSTIEGAIKQARKIAAEDDMQVLVTGSLHLVGGALNLLRPRSEC